MTIYRALVTAGIFLLTACEGSEKLRQNAEQLRDKALQSNRAWEIVESLTTEVGPRLAGTEADARAVAWAKTMLEESGFDDVWLEPVTFPIWQRQRERAKVVAPFPQELQITALGYSGSTNGELVAEVVAFDTLEQLRQADPASVRNKIVFVNQAMYRARDGAGYGDTVGIRRETPVLAREKGAVAALIRSVGTDHHRLPHTGSTTREDRPLPSAALSVPDADQLARILERSDKVTLALDIETSIDANGQSYNVIGQINGSVAPEEILLMGAHLDSWDLGTGAIDDGAGIAIITAAAQLIGEMQTRPRRSIRVVLYANEEQGVWGGKAYAEAHADDLNHYIFASESDFGAGAVWQVHTGNITFANRLRPLLSPLGVAVKSDSNPDRAGADVGPLNERGVPVVRLRQDGTDYFDYHHTANDTLDKVNPETLKQNVAAWAVVYYVAADSESYFRE